MKTRVLKLDQPVRYTDFGGEGPLTMLVHGLGGSSLNWASVGPLLAKKGRVVAIDLPGFGETPMGKRGVKVEANAEVVGHAIEALGQGPALLIGNSMGALVSVLTAGASPSLVRGVVMVCAAMPKPSEARLDKAVATMFGLYAIPGVGEAFLSLREMSVDPHEGVRMMMNLCCVDPSRIEPHVLAAHVAQAERRRAMPWAHKAFLEAARSVVSNIAQSKRYHDRVARVSAPVLVLHGAKDRLVPLASAQALSKRHPRFDLEIFDDVGHTPQLEAPARFVEAVERWAARRL